MSPEFVAFSEFVNKRSPHQGSRCHLLRLSFVLDHSFLSETQNSLSFSFTNNTRKSTLTVYGTGCRTSDYDEEYRAQHLRRWFFHLITMRKSCNEARNFYGATCSNVKYWKPVIPCNSVREQRNQLTKTKRLLTSWRLKRPVAHIDHCCTRIEALLPSIRPPAFSLVFVADTTEWMGRFGKKNYCCFSLFAFCKNYRNMYLAFFLFSRNEETFK